MTNFLQAVLVLALMIAVASIIYGAWLIYVPAAFIVFGIIDFAIAILLIRNLE